MAYPENDGKKTFTELRARPREGTGYLKYFCKVVKISFVIPFNGKKFRI